jgi:superfamily II DNA or RNA helicase
MTNIITDDPHHTTAKAVAEALAAVAGPVIGTTATPAKPAITLRPYQVEAKRAIYAEFRIHRSTLLVLATGLGKSVTLADIVADGLARGRSILVLAHRDELIEQLAGTIAAMTGIEVGMELGKRRDASRPSLLVGRGRVIVSSVQTMRNRLDDIPSDAFDLVIIDESQHARAATYEQIIRHFGGKLLGVTATPERGDKKGLGEVFESVAYDMGLLDGIAEGWLVSIRQKRCNVDLDLSCVRKRAGDLAKDQLAEVMESLDMLRKIAVPTVADLEGRQALVFCVSVRHAELQAESIREVMRECGMVGEVACVTGDTPIAIRREMFARYRRGELRVLTGCDVFTEGTDLPTCSLGVMARPTMSRGLYMQMIGRTSRALPGVVDPWPTAAERKAAIAASAKPYALIIDFVDNSGKHDLVKATDLLGLDDDDPDTKEAEKILARGVTDDLMKAIEMARALRFDRDRARLAREGDFFAIFGLVRETARWGRELSEKQRKLLAEKDIPLVGFDRRAANQAITEIIRRQNRKLCNYKQARVLVRARVPLHVVERSGFEDASAAISRLGAANWHPTGDSWWLETLARADQHVGGNATRV